MGVPREPVHLVGAVSSPRMVAERSTLDWTPAMTRYAAEKAKQLNSLQLSGYILKNNSPSCGMERVKVYGNTGVPVRQGRGLFAAALMRELSPLPFEEEGRLNDPKLRANFIERVFAYHRWQQLACERKAIRPLIDFHTRHKLLLRAHSELHYQRLGRIVATAKGRPIHFAYAFYGPLFMEALAVHATVPKHCNVLEHLMGYFSKELSKEERKELLELVRDFRQRLIPLVVPLTLFRHYVKKYRASYLEDQIYLQPSPKELMLRNQV